MYRKFIDDLEHLDELSKEELKELSLKVRKFDKRENKVDEINKE